MIFRNLKTGNLLTVENKDVIEVMTSSPNYEMVTEAVATPPVATPPPPSPADTEEGNKGGGEGGENATETDDKKTKK